MGEPVGVNIVALDPVLRAGAAAVLHGCPDVQVIADSGPAPVSVMLVDRVDGPALELVRATRKADHRPEVVLVARDCTAGEAADAIAAGVRGLLRRVDADIDRLARAVLAAAGGDCTLPNEVFARLMDHGPRSDQPDAATGPSPLTPRERAVLRLVAEGWETGEIAKELNYSVRTVVGVVHDITHRFRLRNRAHAVAYALRAGIL